MRKVRIFGSMPKVEGRRPGWFGEQVSGMGWVVDGVKKLL